MYTQDIRQEALNRLVDMNQSLLTQRDALSKENQALRAQLLNQGGRIASVETALQHTKKALAH